MCVPHFLHLVKHTLEQKDVTFDFIFLIYILKNNPQKIIFIKIMYMSNILLLGFEKKNLYRMNRKKKIINYNRVAQW